MSLALAGQGCQIFRRGKKIVVYASPTGTYPKGGEPLILSSITDPNFRGDVFPGKIPSRIYVESGPKGYSAECIANPNAPTNPTIDQAWQLLISSTADTELPINFTSVATASGTAATVASITSISASTTVVTVLAANKFAGTETGVVLAGLTGALAVYNGTRTITSASSTQFTFALAGSALSATAGTGTATLISGTISNVAVVANTATITVTNAFTVGEVVVITNLPAGQASLNGPYTILTASGTQFTALATPGTATAYPASLLTDFFTLGLEGPNWAM